MANTCTNIYIIRGNKELLQIFADNFLVKKENEPNYRFNFHKITPIPDNCPNSYQFAIENWGNKWDGTDSEVIFYFEDDESKESEIFIRVDTAWSPCEPITFKLIDLCPGLYIYHEYYEGGEGFIGWIEHQSYEDSEEYTQEDYSYMNDKYDYWLAVFEKEYETFDWLYEHIDYLYDDEEITEDQKNHIQNIIDENYPLETIIQDCIEFNIL